MSSTSDAIVRDASHQCAFLLMGGGRSGQVIEVGPIAKQFREPSHGRTDDVNGRVG